MTKLFEHLLSRMVTWPKEAQDETARSMLNIKKKHVPLYCVSDEERGELDEALAEWKRGEVADDADVAEFFRTHGIRPL